MELRREHDRAQNPRIPQGWSEISLAELAVEDSPICYGIVQVGSFTANGHPVLAIKNLDYDYFVGVHRVSTLIEKTYIRSRIQPGDVLISVKGTTGKVGLVPEGFWGNISRDIARIRPQRCFSANFLYQMLKSDFMQQRLAAAVVGTTRMELSIAILKQVRILLPSSNIEQEAIAKTLIDADVLIELLEKLVVKKRQIKQGVAQELLTGERRLPGFTDKWETKQLGDVAHIKTGTRNNEDKVEDGEYPFFVRSDYVERINSYSHDCEAILIPGEGRIGEIFHYINGRFDVHQRVYAITQFKPGTYAKFVYLYMTAKFGAWAMQNTVKATVDSLRLPTFKTFEMRIPPTESEQAAIATVLLDMEAEISTLEAKLVKTHRLKQGMMQELLTGRIRLVRPSARVLSFPPKEITSTTQTPHNKQISEAVVIAVLSAKFGSEKFPLGRFRRTKFSYLLHRHAEHEAAGFMKKAAGPYNPQTRYGGAEKIALKKRYVRVLSTGKSEGFVADENIAQAEGYFEKWYGAEALTWLEQFRYQKNDALELLTTVDMACEDLSRVGKAATLSAVKQIIQDSPEWKAKLNRAVFSDDNIATTIQSCGQLFPIEEE